MDIINDQISIDFSNNGQYDEDTFRSSFATPPCEDVTKPIGEWNHVKLVVDGPHVEHWMNGTKLLEYDLWSDDWKARVAASKFKDMPPYGLGTTGHIALQDHGDIVSFKNITVTPLN